MSESAPVVPGAEPWSHPGEGAAARVGIAVVHGFSGNPVSTRPLGEAIAKQGYAVEVPRLPGHGTSVQDMTRTRYVDWRAEVERVVDDLAARCDHVVLVGLSMGGTICLDVATRRTDVVRGVATINAQILTREGILARLAPYLSKLLPTIPTKLAGVTPDDIARPGQSEQAYDRISTRAANSFLDELPRIRASLMDLELPVLVLYSPQDHTVPPDNSLAIKELVGGDDVTEIALERSYHVATLDWDADLIETAVIGLVRRVAA